MKKILKTFFLVLLIFSTSYVIAKAAVIDQSRGVPTEITSYKDYNNFPERINDFYFDQFEKDHPFICYKHNSRYFVKRDTRIAVTLKSGRASKTGYVRKIDVGTYKNVVSLDTTNSSYTIKINPEMYSGRGYAEEWFGIDISPHSAKNGSVSIDTVGKPYFIKQGETNRVNDYMAYVLAELQQSRPSDEVAQPPRKSYVNQATWQCQEQDANGGPSALGTLEHPNDMEIEDDIKFEDDTTLDYSLTKEILKIKIEELEKIALGNRSYDYLEKIREEQLSDEESADKIAMYMELLETWEIRRIADSSIGDLEGLSREYLERIVGETGDEVGGWIAETNPDMELIDLYMKLYSISESRRLMKTLRNMDDYEDAIYEASEDMIEIKSRIIEYEDKIANTTNEDEKKRYEDKKEQLEIKYSYYETILNLRKKHLELAGIEEYTLGGFWVYGNKIEDLNAEIVEITELLNNLDIVNNLDREKEIFRLNYLIQVKNDLIDIYTRLDENRTKNNTIDVIKNLRKNADTPELVKLYEDLLKLEELNSVLRIYQLWGDTSILNTHITGYINQWIENYTKEGEIALLAIYEEVLDFTEKLYIHNTINDYKYQLQKLEETEYEQGTNSFADGIGLYGEAVQFTRMWNTINETYNKDYMESVKDLTDYDNIKVEYDAANQRYKVGPFKMKYLEVYTGVQKSSTDDKTVGTQLAGMTGIPKLNVRIDEKTASLKLGEDWNFVYTNPKRNDGIPDSYRLYPHDGEEFYISLNYKEKMDYIENITFNFRYLKADAKYVVYQGLAEKLKWTVNVVRTNNNTRLQANVTVKRYDNDPIAIQDLAKASTARRYYVGSPYGLEDDSEPTKKTRRIDLTTVLAGTVWVEANEQKVGNAHTGIQDNIKEEVGVPGVAVTVYLYNGGQKVGTAIAHDEKGGVIQWPIRTGKDGIYKVDRLEAPGRGRNFKYVVEFEYNGQVYKHTVPLVNNNYQQGSRASYIKKPDDYRNSSMAVEEIADRVRFDNSFGVITGESTDEKYRGQTYTTNEWGELDPKNLGIGEVEYNVENADRAESILQSPKITEPIDSKNRYRMIATTYAENKNTYGIEANFDDSKIQYPLGSNVYVMNGIREKVSSKEVRCIAPHMLHINLGLTVRPETDISLIKDLYKVTLVVNEQKVTKEFNPYGDLSDYNEFLIKLEQNRGNENKAGYTLGLYASDVGYQSANRYGNAIQKVQEIKEGTELRVFATYAVRVYNNSETNDVEIHEIKDYFDPTYTLITNDITTAIVNEDMKREKAIVAEAPYYRVVSAGNTNTWKPTRADNIDGLSKDLYGDFEWNIIDENEEMKTSKSNSLEGYKINNGQYIEIFTTYEINQEGYEKMMSSMDAGFETREKLFGEKFNIAEISSYSTYYTEKDKKGTGYCAYKPGFVSGRVDRDSAPNNLTTTDMKDLKKYEDDSYSAIPLKVELETYEREMYGYVWEDSKNEALSSYNMKVGNGYYEDKEELIPNVEVSLYEVINLSQMNEKGEYDGTYDGLEYYYKVPNEYYSFAKNPKESVVKTTGNKTIAGVDGDVNGNYYIYGFLAGDYVLRYDYGKNADAQDDVNYDGSNDDVVRFNGQDYENTRFLAELTKDKMNDKYLDLTGNTKINGKDINDLPISKARDNESRRIVVDSYSRNIENDRGEILRNREAGEESEFINATRMFAETPVMQIEITDPKNILPSQTLGGTSSNVEKIEPNAKMVQDYKYTIKNMDFGLEPRAETDIYLEKYIDKLILVKSDEVIFTAILNEDGKVDVTNLDNSSLNKLTAFPHSVACDEVLCQQGFYAIEIENEMLKDVSLYISYKVRVVNNSETDFTGRLAQMYLADEMKRAASETPTSDLYKMQIDELEKISLEDLATGGTGISTNSTLAEILELYGNTDTTLQELLAGDFANENIDPSDTLRPEAIIYGRYVGRYYYQNQVDEESADYVITNYSKDVNLEDIEVTYAPDRVVTTSVDQLVDYIDINTGLDLEENTNVENSSWELSGTEESKGNIPSLEKLISKFAYKVDDEGNIVGLCDEKGRKLVDEETSNVALSFNENLEKDEDNNNRVKYKDGTTDVISSYNPKLVRELKPMNYTNDKNEYSGEIHLTTRKNASSTTEANEMRMDNIAEVLVYSNTTGRRDVNSVPGNAIAVAKNNSFWTAGYNSIDAWYKEYKALGGSDVSWEVDKNNWTKYPENDAYSPEYVTIIPPTGIPLRTFIRNNIMQMAGLVVAIIALGVMFVVKQVKIKHEEID